MKDFANEFGVELWKLIRTIAATGCASIGYMIGLPGLILSYIGDAFIIAGEWIDDSIDKKGVFEKDGVEEDVIYI